jgi:pimeloyl-ACP methyl ester carboxylesterase
MRHNKIERQFEQCGLTKNMVDLDGAEVEYWQGGEGPAVVLLHGFGASAIWQWYEQVQVLAPNYRVIVPNLLWFGQSTDSSGDFSLGRQIRVLSLLLDKLGVEETHLLGISYGGLVAYEYAAQYPENSSKVILSDSPGRVYTSRDHEQLKKRFGVKSVQELLLPKTKEHVNRLLDIAYYEPPSTPGFARQQVLEEMYSNHQDEQGKLLQSVLMQIGETQEENSDLESQTLIIWGSDDQVFPLEIGRRLKDHLGTETQLQIIQKARHAPNLEHPQQFNELVTDFLRH